MNIFKLVSVLSENKKIKENELRPETLAVHGGYLQADPTTLSRAVPIYQTSSYVFKDDTHAANLFALKEFGNIYTRIMNPTTDILEKRLALLEGGIGSLCVSSGQSAEFLALSTLLKSGDELLSSSEIYGGTYTLFEYTLGRFGIKTHFVNANDPSLVKKSITPKTKAIFVEALTNPSLTVPDFEALASIAHEHGIPLIVDNTVPSPYLCNPIKWGADIVIHSTTKYIGGHGIVIGGAIIDSGKFDWNSSPHYRSFYEPEPAYHGMNLGETFGPITYILKCRVQALRDLGTAPSPFNSWLTLLGLETLHVRMDRICDNAEKIAKFLSEHEKVAWVNYPSLRSGSEKELFKKYMPKGYSGILGFGVKGGYESAKKVINNVQIFSHLANIGDLKSLIIHPASTTHQQLSSEEQLNAGVKPDYIRLSIGIENVDDLISDLDSALKSITL